jgi:uncharacterized protein YbjT (DUF2867 family)
VLGVRDTAAAQRRWPGHQAIAVDFTRDLQAADWRERLGGVDVVINAVGILGSRGRQTFETVHVQAPRALFEACVQARVNRVIQISALGADEDAKSAYHLSKREADQHLAGLPLRSTVLQPSLVYAPHGTSARWFTMLATLPVFALPGGGHQCLQPIHLQDLCDAVVRLVAQREPPVRVAAVGAAPLTLSEYLAALRAAMGLAPAWVVPVPQALARVVAAVLERLPRAIVTRDTLAMLERGNCADPQPITRLLGRPPRPAHEFIEQPAAVAVRTAAALRWLLPVLRLSLAAMWIVTAVVSAWVYPVQDSLALLARTGLSGAAAVLALYGAAALDFVFGVATLVLRRRQWLYRLQAALIIGYTVVISACLPEFWAHPYGPVLKNVPILAMIWLLHQLDRPERVE